MPGVFLSHMCRVVPIGGASSGFLLPRTIRAFGEGWRPSADRKGCCRASGQVVLPRRVGGPWEKTPKDQNNDKGKLTCTTSPSDLQ